MTDLPKSSQQSLKDSCEKEWPGYEAPAKGSRTSIPLLICEIYRLIPFIGPRYVNFHPKNMPEVVLHKIEITGIVTQIKEMGNYISYTVDDSTSAIPVLYYKKFKTEDELCKQREALGNERSVQDSLFRAKIQPRVFNEIVMYDYIQVVGFCSMSHRYKKCIRDLNDEDLKLGTIFFYGTNIRKIGEKQYNLMLLELIAQLAVKRYRKPKASQ